MQSYHLPVHDWGPLKTSPFPNSLEFRERHNVSVVNSINSPGRERLMIPMDRVRPLFGSNLREVPYER